MAGYEKVEIKKEARASEKRTRAERVSLKSTNLPYVPSYLDCVSTTLYTFL